MQNITPLNILGINIVLLSCMINLPLALAHNGVHKNGMAGEPSVFGEKTIHVEIFLKEPLVKDKKTLTELGLYSKKDRKLLLPSEIKGTHTEKMHLLIFDQTLTDYQHVHPTLTNKPGVYQFEWTPKKASKYKVWVDLIPLSTGLQEYIRANLADLSKASDKAPEEIDKTPSLTSSIGEGKDKLYFTLSFDPKELILGKPEIGKVSIKDSDGHPFTQLEPVMGAFAHIVAINEDFKTIAHIHPMGVEPSKNSDKGGPDLKFEIELHKPGFWKIWVQVKVNEKDIFVPFGVNVK